MNATLRSKKNWIIALLVLAVLLQTALVLNTYAIDWGKRVWRLRALPAEERSGIFFLGSRPAEFVKFLEAVTPEGATLVIPPRADWLSYQSILLFFLEPRRAVACSCEPLNEDFELPSACMQCLQAPDTYIPAIGEFPPSAAVSAKEFIPYDQDTGFFHGVYVPRGQVVPEGQAEGAGAYAPMRSVLTALAVWLVLFLLGGLGTAAILGRFAWLEVLSLAVPLGVASVTWFVFLTSWAGVTLTLVSFGVVSLAIAAVGIWLISRRARSGDFEFGNIGGQSHRFVLRSLGPLGWAVLLVLLGFLLAAVVLSVGKAYSSFDAMIIWSLKGYGIAYEQTIFAQHRLGGHGLAYPLNISLIATLFRFIDGDILPGSKLIFPLFTASLLLGCLRFWIREGVDFLLGLLGMVLLLTVPLVFDHATTGFANLPFTTYLVLGTLWSIEGLYDDRPRSLFMGGLLLALAGWTRSEGLGFSLVIIAALIVARLIAQRKFWPPLYWLVPIVLIPVIWSLLGSQYLSGDEIGLVLRNFLDDTAGGTLDLSDLGIILGYAARQFRTPHIWGVIIFACLVLFLLGLRYLQPRKYPRNFSLFLAFLAAAAVPVGMMFVASTTKDPLVGWLAVSMDRALFPAVFLGTVLCILLGNLYLSREDSKPEGDRPLLI